MVVVVRHESVGFSTDEHRAMIIALHRKCNTLSLGRWRAVDSLTTHLYTFITSLLQSVFILSFCENVGLHRGSCRPRRSFV